MPTTKFMTNRPPSIRILRDDVVDQVVGQAELGDAVAQHAAERVERLEHRHREALRGQQVGVDEPGGAGPDDRHRRVGGRLPRIAHTGEPALGRLRVDQLLPLRQVPLELPDRDRQFLDAHALALQFLRAYPPGDIG
ncbi:MAG: hypothetical protein V9G10_12960 [Candidatus Nanopelagicales bacterium]